MTSLMQQHLQQRSQSLQQIHEVLQDTIKLYQQHAARIEERPAEMTLFSQSLREKSRLKIVVTGEYSTGKSTLINALLGIRLLPMALQPTTCVNAFLEGVTEGEKPSIKIEFVNGQVQHLAYSSEEIERWGSELDEQNKEQRQQIKKIVIYSDHPLLRSDLQIIDTPGFQSIEPRHEKIAMQAIREAHVALWLLSAQQMGGRQTEWDFLEQKLNETFERIIVAINLWDVVWEQEDNQKPLEQRDREYLNIFARAVANRNIKSEMKQALSQHENLFKLSAKWYLSDKPEQKRKAAPEMERLARKIESICKSVDTQREILAKPLRQIISWQAELLQEVENDLGACRMAEDPQKLADEEAKLHNEIERLKQNMDKANWGTKKEHDYQQKEMSRRIEDDFIQPLRALKKDAEDIITKDYVRRQLQKSDSIVSIPPSLKDRQQKLLANVDAAWKTFRTDLTKILQALSVEHEKEMGESLQSLRQRLQTKQFSLPPLQVKVDVDFSEIQSFLAQKAELERERLALQEQQQHIDIEIAKNRYDIDSLQEKKKKIERDSRDLEQQHNSLGAPPPARISYIEKYDEENDGFFSWIWRKIAGGKKPTIKVEVKDDSEREDWKKQKSELERRKQEKNKEIDHIIEKEKERTGMLIGREAAQRKVEADLRRREREMEEFEKKANTALEEQITETFSSLRAETVDALDRMERSFAEEIKQTVEKCFSQNIKSLQQAIEKNILLPLQRQESRLQDVQRQKQESEEKLQAEIKRLALAKKEVQDILEYTKQLQQQLCY